MKPILCLDFDGVIHSYESGWKGADVIPDPPVPGALEFIKGALQHFTVAIYSSRSGQPGGIAAMQEWLAYWLTNTMHGTADARHAADMIVGGEVQWPTEKPPAFLTIDDRAMTFDGTWPAIETLKGFKPWNKR